MLPTILSYLTIYVVWSTTAFAIKLGVGTIPPFYYVAIRFGIGGTLLLLFTLFTGKLKDSVSIKQILSSMLIGFLLLIGGNGLVSVAVTKVDSYIAALIIGTIPIFVLIFDRLLLKRKVATSSLIGIIFGIIGIATLIYNPSKTSVSMHPYIIFVFIAVVSWSLGMTLSKILPTPKDTIINSGIQQFSMGALSFIMMQFITPINTVNWSDISLTSILALTYLIIFGTMLLSKFIICLLYI